MTREDYQYAKSIYDKMFFMQVFKPDEMKKAFRCLFNEEAANTQQARARVAAFFRYGVTPVFSDETISVNNEGQSHQEDLAPDFIEDVKESGWLEDVSDTPAPSLDEIGKVNKVKRKPKSK